LAVKNGSHWDKVMHAEYQKQKFIRRRRNMRGGCAQALTAEMNMQTTQFEHDKAELARLRNENVDWKKKYYDCRHKAATQYDGSSSLLFI